MDLLALTSLEIAEVVELETEKIRSKGKDLGKEIELDFFQKKRNSGVL